MKKIFIIFIALGLAFFATSVSAAKLGNQVGAEQTKAQVTAMDGEGTVSPNPISGDGVPNRTQDEEYGNYGEGESPNELSGDGIPNRTQDEEYGQYGTGTGDGDQDRVREQLRDQDCDGEDCDMVQTQAREQVRQEDGGGEQEREQVRAEIAEMNAGDLEKVKARQQTATQALNGLRTASEQVDSRVAGPRLAALIEELELGNEEALLAETKLAKRSGFAKFFIGGDDDAAEDVKRVANENKERLQEMTQIMEACTECEEPVKTELKLQTQMLEQEQLRLEELAEKEMNRKGLFGFLFGWMK